MLAAALLPLSAGATTGQQDRFGATPAEWRAIEGRVGSLQGDIARRAAQNRISSETLFAVARHLGLRNPNASLGELLGLIDRSAKQAGELRGQISELQAQVAQLTDAALRTPAMASLVQAQQAFDAGRLEMPRML